MQSELFRAHFAQDVSISKRYVDASKLISYDEIRDKLKEMGIILEDTPNGVKWSRA